MKKYNLNNNDAFVFDNNDQTINNELKKHFSKLNSMDKIWMKESFSKEGYLKITDYIPESIKMEITKEAKHLLKLHSKRRNVKIKVTDNSPRIMSNVTQQVIAKEGKVIPAVYHSSSLMDFIGEIGNEEITPNPWEYEKFIVNMQEKSGDTHGWHWGDYPYSLIWIIQAPSIDYGGLLECVPHTYWDKKNPRIQEHLLRNSIKTKFHITGDVYLLKSDTTLHRVTPLLKDTTRIIINMAWERKVDIGRIVTHETFAFRD